MRRPPSYDADPPPWQRVSATVLPIVVDVSIRHEASAGAKEEMVLDVSSDGFMNAYQ